MFSPRCMYNIGLSHDFQMTLTFRAKFYTYIPSKINPAYICTLAATTDFRYFVQTVWTPKAQFKSKILNFEK